MKVDRIDREAQRGGPRLLSPLRDFIATESAGGVLLVAGVLLALAWANSPWSAGYDSLWSTRIALDIAGHGLDLTVRQWLNDGLMTVFFLVVGLEIKRELTDGHLATRRAALLPAFAAVGGMAVPAALYLAIAGTSAPRGWAIPVATDIALAIGVLAIAGPRVPTQLRAFLLALAIVDDICAIAIIAVFYSNGLSLRWIAGGAAMLALCCAARAVGVHQVVVFCVLGTGLWFALHEAGVHPTMAGVMLGLLAPSQARLAPEYVDIDELIDVSTAEAARTTSELARGSVSVVEWLQHVLHPWTSFVIVPLFAFANAGIEISGSGLRRVVGSALAWGIVAGLVIGKPLGVGAAVWLTTRAGVASMPDGVDRQQLIGVGAAAGVGLTVALFITELAFSGQQQQDAKLAVLAASLIAAIASTLILRRKASAERA